MCVYIYIPCLSMHHTQLRSMRHPQTQSTGMSGWCSGSTGAGTSAGGDQQFDAAVRLHCPSTCTCITYTLHSLRDRWAELCKAIRHCNEKAKYCL